MHYPLLIISLLIFSLASPVVLEEIPGDVTLRDQVKADTVEQQAVDNITFHGFYETEFQDYRVKWGWVDKEKTIFRFNVTANTTGWIAVGFNAERLYMPGIF